MEQDESQSMTEIAECGHREAVENIEDGKCRTCRGVPMRRDYIPQKERLEADERIAHAENESRSHIINNDR